MILPRSLYPERGDSLRDPEPLTRTMDAVNMLSEQRYGNSLTSGYGVTTSRPALPREMVVLARITGGDPSAPGLGYWELVDVLIEEEDDEFSLEVNARPAFRGHTADGGSGLAYNTAGVWAPPGTVVLLTRRRAVRGETLWMYHASPSSLAVPGLLGASSVVTPNLWDYAWAEAAMTDADTWETVPGGIVEVARNAMEYGNAATGQQGIGVTLPVSGVAVTLLPVKSGLPLSFEPHGYIGDSGENPVVAFRWQFSAPNGIAVVCENGGGA